MKNPKILPTRMGAARNPKFLVAIVLISLVSAAVLPSSLSSSLSVAAKAEPRETAGPTARESAGKNRTAFRSMKPAAPTVPHVLPASYYSLKGNLSSTLTLNNKGPQPLDIQPTLFSLDGQRLDVPPVTVDGTSFRVIDLRQWAVPGAGFDEGSLQIAHYGMDLQLGAQVKIIDADHSLIFAEQLMQMMSMSSRLEGVWWLRSPKCNVRLVLSNTTDSAFAAAVSIDGLVPRQPTPLTLNLAAHETRLINPQDLATNGNGTLREIGGISVSYNGAPGSLLAHGFIDEASTGFSSSIEFLDPSMAHSSKLDGGGLRLGRLAGQELTPVVVARNVGTTESIISGSMPYNTNNGTASLVPIPEIRLGPGELGTVDVARAIRRSHLDLGRVVSAGLEFTYSSTPGSVVISAQSVSSDGNQVFRLPLIDADAQPSSTGGYPWSIRGSSSTFVYLTNVTDRPQQYVLQLNFQGGVYAPGLKTVQPNQTAVIDLRALRDSQVRDEHGHTIPGDKSSGQVTWSVEGGENLVLIGRAEQADLVKGISSSYACVNCCPASCVATWVDPPSVTGFAGDTQQFSPFQQNEDCFGNVLQPFSISNATWSSTNSSVATVNTTGFVTAQNVGTTNIGASWSAWLWDQTPNKTCFKTHIFPNPTAICDVLLSAIEFTEATYWTDVRSTFSLNIGRYSTNLNIGGSERGSSACGGGQFAFVAKFILPQFHKQLRGAPFTHVTLSGSSQYRLVSGASGQPWEFVDLTETGGEIHVTLQRTGEGNGNTVLITIGGVYQSGGNYTGRASVSLICPNP